MDNQGVEPWTKATHRVRRVLLMISWICLPFPNHVLQREYATPAPIAHRNIFYSLK